MAWQTSPANPDMAGRTCHVVTYHGIPRNEVLQGALSTLTSPAVTQSIVELDDYTQIIAKIFCTLISLIIYTKEATPFSPTNPISPHEMTF